jgi:phage terminase Nu1 subunit (DNA packaging protein)
MTLLPSPDVICDREQLASVLGVSSRQVDRLVVDKVLKPVRCKLRGKHFRLSASVQSYLAHRERYVTARAKANDDAYIVARAKRMEALAAKEQLSLAAMKGDYFRRDDLNFHITQMITACRSRLMAVPSRVMFQLVGVTDSRKANQIVDTEIRRALLEFSEGKWRKTVEFLKAEAAYLRAQGLPDDEIEKLHDERDRREAQERNGELPPE